MKKKTVIILGSVVVVCGAFSSLFVDWPVDFSGASGDIAKATRFSREQASEKLTNMEELLQNDSAFKDGIVAAQVVMQTRAVQFASLVDMSNEVAGDIPAFAEVLKDMNAASKMVENVNNSLAEAGDDLNAALVGEERPDLAQNTINASLAYTTLQKQNKLATRFIETTDKYLETAQGDDKLKLVRDQWLEYQQMTAALEGDKASAEALAKKGNLLSGEQALAAVGKYGLAEQLVILQSCELAQNMNVETKLGYTIPLQALERICSVFRNAAEVTVKSVNDGLALNNQEVEKIFNNALDEAMKNASTEVVASMQKFGLNNVQKEVLAHRKIDAHNAQKEVLAHRKIDAHNALMIGSASKVMEAFNSALNNAGKIQNLNQNQNFSLNQTIGNVISQTAAASNSEKLAGAAGKAGKVSKKVIK